MQQSDLIKKCKDYAKSNYSKGYDTFVECYGNDEWVEFLSGYFIDGEEVLPPITSWNKAKSLMKQVASVWSEQRADAQYYIENA